MSRTVEKILSAAALMQNKLNHFWEMAQPISVLRIDRLLRTFTLGVIMGLSTRGGA